MSSKVSSKDDVVIVEAVRTPIGKRGGGMAGFHSADLLGIAQSEALIRAKADPKSVDQVIGGCISQVGQQAFNVTRTAWLTAGLPESTAATTVDSQCGSSQQANTFAHGLLAASLVDVAMACGVEVMSRVPLGSGLSSGVGKGVPKSYFSKYEYTNQFEAAERIAEAWGLTRGDTDTLGVESQARAARAWAEGRFDTQVVGLDAPDADDTGSPTGGTHRVERDECLRTTTMEGLANLKPVAREDGIHTAGTSSQLADAAAAVLLTRREVAESLGLRARARVLDSCLVGSDPVLMLTGPITATQLLLQRNGMTIDDVDVIEINEAFASVVLAWEREIKPDHERVNPNGGAIAMGHALGSTGCVLLTKALHELERTDKSIALVTMCCGGGMATGTLLERI
ncbi:MAG TPA: steroid 3-ketoacyl-CoA thiolase [Acidimicrobiales bacterium]|jgi:acetyl-CoA C-acetyltransferase|nr:steroid 3-ketoacyl-CoA thiolase [Acidimicrobiales bacterium]